jgi:uncharacterized damage-inducible protein DinB
MLAGQLEGARERLLESFAGLSEEDMLQPGVRDDWSVRDILAHVAAWEREMTRAFRSMVAGERPPFMDLDDEAIEEFNRQRRRETEEATLDEVLTELNGAREDLIEFLRGVDNQALFAPAPGDDHADFSIAACLKIPISHDEEFAEAIEEWRDREQK